jgi:hypothetical protein
VLARAKPRRATVLARAKPRRVTALARAKPRRVTALVRAKLREVTALVRGKRLRVTALALARRPQRRPAFKSRMRSWPDKSAGHDAVSVKLTTSLYYTDFSKKTR